MERLTQKHDFFDYVLPEQNVVGDNQATEVILGDTEYTCKKYIIGEAIKKLGELEDVLEKYGIKNAEELDKFIYHKDCQIKKWKQDYENCSKLEKSMSKEHQYCLDNWRVCEQELAELKQKAIVPKFKVGQEIYIVCDFNINRIVYGWKIADYEYYKQLYIVVNKDGIDWLPEEKIFATKEEAEQKLAEIKGEKDE